MATEHRQLDELWKQASGERGGADPDAYQRFRETLLRHIKIEERILLPMVTRKRGEPLPIAARLRLDHGAFAALLMLPPAAHTFGAIRTVLDAHNPLEEDDDGVYDQCDRFVAEEIAEVLARIADTPRVPVSAWIDSAKVLASAQRVLTRAGYDSAVLRPIHSKQT